MTTKAEFDAFISGLRIGFPDERRFRDALDKISNMVNDLTTTPEVKALREEAERISDAVFDETGSFLQPKRLTRSTSTTVGKISPQRLRQQRRRPMSLPLPQLPLNRSRNPLLSPLWPILPRLNR